MTNNIEKYGSGFIRIRKELEKYPDVSFSVEEVGGGVLVTFRKSEGVSEGVARLLDTIQKNPGARLPELSAKMHVPVKTLERWVKQLRDEGKIKFCGAPKTGGYYIVHGND